MRKQSERRRHVSQQDFTDPGVTLQLTDTQCKAKSKNLFFFLKKKKESKLPRNSGQRVAEGFFFHSLSLPDELFQNNCWVLNSKTFKDQNSRVIFFTTTPSGSCSLSLADKIIFQPTPGGPSINKLEISKGLFSAFWLPVGATPFVSFIWKSNLTKKKREHASVQNRQARPLSPPPFPHPPSVHCRVWSVLCQNNVYCMQLSAQRAPRAWETSCFPPVIPSIRRKWKLNADLWLLLHNKQGQ